MDNIKIIIADDHALFTNGLRLMLRQEPGIEVVDTAGNGRELLDILAHTKADIILLDINMPIMNGLEAGRFIKQKYPGIKLIMLSTYNDAHLVEKARELGVHGYLLKNSSRTELVQAILLVMNNKTSFPYLQPTQENFFDGEDSFLKQFNLTKREREIIQMLKNGLTNQQMAEALFLSIYTVETHRKNIMQKLALKTPAALVKFILEHRL